MKKITFLAVHFTVSFICFVNAQSINPSPYCVATFDDVPFNVPNAIKSVTFGTLTNTTNSQFAFPHYVFYNNLTTPNLVKGTTYPLNLIFNVNGGCGYGVWIDYNQNNLFELDEKVSGTTNSSLNISSNTSVSANINIPSTALTGLTRMRVRIVEDDNFTFSGNLYNILPCNLGTTPTTIMDWGETEDYVLNISSSLGISESFASADLKIFPNPTTEILNIVNNYSENLNYKITNLNGQVIESGALLNINKQINVSSLFAGLYFLSLFENNNLVIQQKFIKK